MKTLSIALGLALASASAHSVEINLGNLLKQALREAQAKPAQQPASEPLPASGTTDEKNTDEHAVTAGSLVGKTYPDPLQLSKELHREGLRDEQSFNLGAANANNWVASYIAGNGDRRILLTKSRNATQWVLADLAVPNVPKGLLFIGSSELAAEDEGTTTTCTINGRRATVFGYMQRTSQGFRGVKADLVWQLDATGHVVPAGGGKVACR